MPRTGVRRTAVLALVTDVDYVVCCRSAKVLSIKAKRSLGSASSVAVTAYAGPCSGAEI